MIINHNMSALFAHRSLRFNNINVDKNMEKLSSGQRITAPETTRPVSLSRRR
jgi:flagellin